MYKITLLCAFVILCISAEEAERAIYLQPRNFNPHPFQTGYEARIRGSGNVGPVLFPETPPDPDDPNENYKNINADGDNRLSDDSPPYTSVVLKHKYEQSSGFESNQEKKNYAFSYQVQDHISGDDYSHVQRQNSKATDGEYRVKLPDGRLQIVSYTADKNGYKADVKYTEDESFHRTPFASNSKQQKHPQKIRMKFKPKLYDYLYDDDTTNVGDSNLQNKHQDLLYDDYETSQRYHPLQNLIQYKVNSNLILGVVGQDQHQLTKINVHSLNNEKVEKFIASTLAPYILDSSKGFQQNVLSSFGSDKSQFSQVQINTPNFQLVNGDAPQHLIYQK